MSDNQYEPPPRVTDFADNGPRNPFGEGNAVAVAPTAGLVSVEQRKVMAEVQARILMARSMPRDGLKCADLIIRDCTRVSLANKALYSYARGGQDITGPSIRLAEAVAQRWGNVASGIKELSRSNGYSECVAYAWDLESGYYDERQFQVRHWRDTRGGGYALTDERDIYEIVANSGARRKRAALLAVIPGDVIELAIQECERTLHASADTSPDAVLKIVETFDKIGVTRAMLEKRIQRRMEAIRPAQIVQLRKIYASLMDEMSTPEEWFEPEGAPSGVWAGVDAAHQQAQRPTVNPPAARKAAAKKAPANEAKPPAEPTRTAPRKEAAQSNAKPAEDDGIPYDRWEPPSPDAVAQTSQQVAAAASGSEGGPDRTDIGQTVVGPTSGGNPGNTFEAWLLDEHGDPAEDEPHYDPRTFADALAASIEKTPANRVNLLMQNADGIDAAKAVRDGDVTAILARLENDVMEPAQAEPPAEESPGAFVVELTMDRGKPVVGVYLKAFKAAVGDLVLANWNDFIDLNRSTMMRCEPSTCSLLMKALSERAKAIGAVIPPDLAPSLLQRGKPKPSPESTPPTDSKPAEDPDWQAARNRVQELRTCQNSHEFEAMGRGIVIKNFVERLDREGKAEIATWMRAEAEKRRAELKGAG